MFIYLSKKIKIAIPNPVQLNSLSWSRDKGWIGVGGEDGLLKVIKLDDKDDHGRNNLTMNQTLPGHNGAVKVITWNEQYRKLTTSDQYGLIIVWMLYKGQWYEEMINNRNKSVVVDMQWTSDGSQICIAYKDGHVIVGGVKGNRIWRKDVKLTLCQVEWSPNGKSILFGTEKGEVKAYDNSGNLVATLDIPCLDGLSEAKLVTMTWYDGRFGYMDTDAPVLAICYEVGRMQLMRSEKDHAPILVDAYMKIVCARWNNNGTVLAVAGSQDTGDTTTCAVQFYTPHGEHLRTLKVPGKVISAISWEVGGLKLAITVDHFIYFSNVRPDYRWGYFNGTVVYAFNKQERADHCVVFWDIKMNGRTVKYVKNLIGIAACGEYCVLSTKANDNSGQYILILCNAIGTPIMSKYIDVEPVFMEMSKTHVVVASHSCGYIWNFAQTKASETKTSKKRDEKIFHIDDSPTGGKDTDPVKFKKSKQDTRDPICAICVSDQMLMIGRESGTLHQYPLPKGNLDVKHVLNCRPARISLNCNSTRLAVIDIEGVLTFFDTQVKRTNQETGQVQYGEHIASFERKDVWDMMWADDNPELFAMMERSYMYIFRDLDPEEPIPSNSYISHFSNLQVESVNIDGVMKSPETPTNEHYFTREIKSLRDTRALLDTVTIEDAYSYIEQNPHARLWRLLAESALLQLDLDIADKAFVRCKDLQGIEFVQKLVKFDDENKQKAQVNAYFQKFGDAQDLYLEMDRVDLAVAMREKLGDWVRVIRLLKSKGGSSNDNDKLLKQAWANLGHYYFDRQQYEEANKMYTNGGHFEGRVECCYRLEDWHCLSELVYMLPEEHELLLNLGKKLASVGMCSQAVNAYVKAGNIQEAINVCVHLNQWDQAVALANQHNVKEINALLAKYASHYLSKGKRVEAIELYRQANHFLDTAKYLFELAESVSSRGDPLMCKKLYVLGAVQVEEYHESKTSSSDHTKSTLDNLLDDDALDGSYSKIIEGAWRGAEAYHFFMLAQRQLYSGKHSDAIRTAMRVCDYDDILDPLKVYSVLALAAVATGNFGLCSKAFIKLESISEGKMRLHEQIEALALTIFRNNAPKDKASDVLQCPKCSTNNPDWTTSCSSCDYAFLPSIASGRSMVFLEYWICGCCKHRATEEEIRGYDFCPLCHCSV
eukprot:m.61099 g.61099  ORF g.61099 m.61099 type:complete len:1163 (+) comp11378_c0_seq1:91-3579(+)